MVVFYLLLEDLGEHFGEVFFLDRNAKLLLDDLQQDLLNFRCLKQVLGRFDDPGLNVFAPLGLREEEEDEKVREDLHGHGAGRAVWRVGDGQAFIQRRFLSSLRREIISLLAGKSRVRI